MREALAEEKRQLADPCQLFLVTAKATAQSAALPWLALFVAGRVRRLQAIQ